jgi:cytochrome P450
MVRDFVREPLVLFERLSRRGDVVRLPLARAGWHLVSDPDLVREVLVTRRHDFEKGIALQRARMFLGDGLLTSEGEGHGARRRLVQPAFHGQRLERCAAVMVQRSLLARERPADGDVLEIWAEMMRLTLAIVGPALFATELEHEAEEMRATLTEAMGLFDVVTALAAPVLARLGTPRMRRLQAARARLDALVGRIVDARRDDPVDRGDLLSMLVLARDEDGGPGLSREALRDEATTLLIAGHETTANALTWTWHLLAAHPAAQARLHAELDAALGGRPATVADLPRLRYADMVLAEALRLYPPAWGIPRRALRPVRVGPYTLQPGAIVVVSPWAMHRDPRLWDAPLRFDPDRWAESPPSQPRPGYMPFGAGPRGCVGRPFALMEGVLVLATLAQAWRVRPVPGRPARPRPSITLRPEGGLWLRVDRRRSVTG